MSGAPEIAVFELDYFLLSHRNHPTTFSEVFRDHGLLSIQLLVADRNQKPSEALKSTELHFSLSGSDPFRVGLVGLHMLYQGPSQKQHPARAAADDTEDEDANAALYGRKIPTQISTGSYNIHSALVTQITRSEYYRFDLVGIDDFEAILDEIRQHVRDLEPTLVGRPTHPSSAFCILYRLCELGVYEKQMRAMIHRKQRAMVRGVGFLYLRYLLPPSQLWSWFSPHLDDKQQIAWGGGMQKEVITIGQFLQRILTEHKYFSTYFPRIPVPIEKEIKVKLIEYEVLEKRAAENEKIRPELREGLRVMAEYSEDKEWYEAVIDRLLPDGHILVTFTEYGNQEEVDIGCIRLVRRSRSPMRGGRSRSPSRRRRSRSRSRRYRDDRDSRRRRYSRSRSRNRSRRRSSGRGSSRRRSRRSRSRSPRRRAERGRSRSRSSSERRGELGREDLLRIVEERERAKAVVSSGRGYAKPVRSIKSSISVGLRASGSSSDRYRSRSPPVRKRPAAGVGAEADKPPPPKELTAEQKLRRFKLMAKYGDASANEKL